MFARAFRLLLGLLGLLLALRVIILRVMFGSGAMRLCRSLVKFRRLVVCVFHFDLILRGPLARAP